GAGAVDPEALALKGEYLKGVLPDLRDNKGDIRQESKEAARAKALAMAEKLVAKHQIAAHAKELADFDQSLLPVPVRAGKQSGLTKLGKSMGRAFSKSSVKTRRSDKAQQLRKGVDAMDGDQTEQAYKQ
ncbi:MAG TPA: hypothetical protein PLV68_04310, partial [Ilumatobacteraceae bacterium]|nr:hypothetical protein [Ilumatobacteraceae bacterium]